MKTLIAPLATKAIDQTTDVGSYSLGRYIPLEDLRSWSGYGISPELAMNMITVYQCVSILSETFASIPLILYRRNPDDSRERATDHPLYQTLHDEPNPTMTSFVWRELVSTHLKTWGNHFSEIVQAGPYTQLWPIRPDRMELKWGADGAKVFTYRSPLGGSTEIPPERMFHVQAGSSSGLVGESPINAMRGALALYAAGEQFGTSFFRNGARPATVLKHPKELSKGAIERLGAQMDALRGAGNAGKTVVLEEGLDFSEVGVPPETAQFLETRLFQKREIAAAFHMPGGIIGDHEQKESEEQETLKLVKRALVPDFERFEAEVQRQLIPRDEKGVLYGEFLLDAYLRGDPKARSDALAVMWEHGALNGNEWRKKENLDPIGPEGDVFYRPANWAPLGDQPVPVGGDTSTPTQFGAGNATVQMDAQMVDQMTRAKAMAQFDCPACGKLIARKAAPGTIGYCRACRDEREMPEAAA